MVVASAEPHFSTLLGGLNKDAQGAWRLTNAQCNIFLSSQWDYVNYWMKEFFPTFTPQSGATQAEILTVQTMLRIWIFHYGSASLHYNDDWAVVKATFNTVNLDWTRVLAWAGTTPGYYDGTTTHSLPPKVAAWVQGDTSDLFAFNTWTTLCDAGSCGFKTQCCDTPKFSESPCCKN